MNYLKLLLIALTFHGTAVTAESWSGWSRQVVSLVALRNSQPLNPLNPLCLAIREYARTSFWGTWTGQKEIVLPLSQRHFAQPTAKGEMNVLEGQIAWSKSERADTIVFLPGIFQAANHVIPASMAEKLSALGFHILTLPAPFADTYLQRLPFAAVGSFETEAQVYLQAIKGLKALHPERIGKIHIVGLSYGGFLAAVMAATDNEQIIDGQVTLLSPTFHMSTTQRLIDEMVERGFKQPWKYPCSRAAASQTLPDIIRFTNALFGQYQAHRHQPWWSQRFSPQARAEFDRVRALDPGARKTWEESLGFQNVLRRYTSENLHYYAQEQDRIAYWLGVARERGFTRFRWLSAKDDFLNDPSELDQEAVVPAWLKDPQVGLLINDGSHFSYVNWTVGHTSWFNWFLEAAFLK
ncbi:MAG: hypothetical protein AB7G93_12880 [Bdellovibrionales bacterium]